MSLVLHHHLPLHQSQRNDHQCYLIHQFFTTTKPKSDDTIETKHQNDNSNSISIEIKENDFTFNDRNRKKKNQNNTLPVDIVDECEIFLNYSYFFHKI